MVFLGKLFSALNNTRNSISNALSVLKKKEVTTKLLEDIESSLIIADLGIKTVDDIIDIVKNTKKSDFIPKVEDYLESILPEGRIESGDINGKIVIMVVGVNGTGKTTTTAKLAHYYQSLGKKVILVGCDTYRAAALEQLDTWAKRLNIRMICNEKSQEPSAVLFDGMTAADTFSSDIVIVDTAGRLHTNKNLMEELAKMERVISNKFSHYKLTTYITIDANLGQNSFLQANRFNDYIKIDGVVLTKMDGTAKGGIIFSLYRELGIPVQFIGVGEDLRDLILFNRKEYVNSLLGKNE